MPHITSLNIQGFRPFRDFTANLGKLEVLVGANGSGKSALFEFLKFLRDGADRPLPPQLIAETASKSLFHIPGPERFTWRLEMEFDEPEPYWLGYWGEISGPIGRVNIVSEEAAYRLRKSGIGMTLFERKEGKKQRLQEPNGGATPFTVEFNQLTLAILNNPGQTMLYRLRDYILNWRFYSAFNINTQKLRQPTFTDQHPTLNEDVGNLTAVLFHFMTEYPETFKELLAIMRLLVPNFDTLKVKAFGGPGQIMAFWREKGIDHDFMLADMSDGMICLLAWTLLCVMPNPPSLICIDEPDQGIHPRTLPILAGLFERASERTQILLATHSSYFLTHFRLENVAVMRKTDGAVQFIKPQTSLALVDILEEFGAHEVERMHQSGELEGLA